MKHWYPISREEIHYVLDDFYLRTQIWFCVMDGRDIECTAGPESIHRRPPDCSYGLEFPLFVFFGQQDPHTNLETNPDWTKIFQTRFKLAV